MPVNEMMAKLQAGETFIAPAPGTVEFVAAPQAAPVAKVAAAKGAGAAMVPAAATTTAAGAQSMPVALLSGKVLGFSLGAVNPWLLLGVGALGGYYYCKKKRFSFF
ncbi:hypothetical protein [Magnetococcus sp. PR-3]|uniref:hypothetical protein n=1 Tax=Magnetococcus sp. PR-3 TaxID=3120355 RepID=UPI002FCE0EB7